MTTFHLSEAAIQRRRARDRRDRLTHLTHEAGLCGAMVSACCSDCYRDEVVELQAWARQQAPPNPGDTPSSYWRRIGGAFLDAWYEVASTQIKAGVVVGYFEGL